MNILVLNASPKGDYSITLQTVNYLQRLYPDQKFTTLHVGQQIKSLERDFSKAAALLREADVLLFSYPVYTFIAPSQLHRFIELVKEHKIDLRGKFDGSETGSAKSADAAGASTAQSAKNKGSMSGIMLLGVIVIVGVIVFACVQTGGGKAMGAKLGRNIREMTGGLIGKKKDNDTE